MIMTFLLEGCKNEKVNNVLLLSDPLTSSAKVNLDFFALFNQIFDDFQCLVFMAVLCPFQSGSGKI